MTFLVNIQRAKPFFTRNFSAITKGGVRSSVFTMFSGTVGAGILSLPYVKRHLKPLKIISYYGLALGASLIILFSLVTYTSFSCLNDMVIRSGKKSYVNIASYYLGKTNGKIIAQFLILSQFTTAILYPSISKDPKSHQKKVWQFSANLLNTLGIADIPYSDKASKQIDQHSPEAWKYRVITMGILALFIFPFNLQKRLATLRYLSVFIMVVILITIGVSLFQCPFYFEEYKDDRNYHIDWIAAPFNIRWLQGFSTMMLSYNCIITFFYVRGEMRHKTRQRVQKVIRYLLMIEASFYTLIAIAGYVSLGADMVPHVFTLRRKLSKKSSFGFFNILFGANLNLQLAPDSKDTLMIACQFLFTIAISFHIPISLFPAREQIYIYYGLERKGKTHVTLTLVMTLVCVLVPTFYPDIIGLLGLVGGITVGTAAYVLPFLLAFRSLEKECKWYHLKRLRYLVLFYFSIFLGSGSVYCSLFLKNGSRGE